MDALLGPQKSESTPSTQSDQKVINITSPGGHQALMGWTAPQGRGEAPEGATSPFLTAHLGTIIGGSAVLLWESSYQHVALRCAAR